MMQSFKGNKGNNYDFCIDFSKLIQVFTSSTLVPVPDMTLFDEHGNKTAIPNKERQVEALQLLFLLLPQANRSLLKLLLDLLYHTAKQQDKNKMSAFNLALMFAPHVLWPRHVRSVSVYNCIIRVHGPRLC